MDNRRFDALTKNLAGSATRRTGIKLLIATLAGAAWGPFARGTTVGQICEPLGQGCAEDRDCCSGACRDGRCADVSTSTEDRAGPAEPARDCTEAGKACTHGSQCCTGFCGENDRCACRPLGRACGAATDCCSGVCDGRTCRCPPDKRRCGNRCCAIGQRCDDGRCVDRDQCQPEDATVTCRGLGCGDATNRCGQTVNCGRCKRGACQDGTCVVTAPPRDPQTILASYNFRTGGSTPYGLTAYRPRQFRPGLVVADPTRGALTVEDPGPYDGWDILPTINEGVRRIATWSDWVQMELNREATLIIVWRGGDARPAWLNDWTTGPEVVVAGKRWPTFRRTFPAGAVDLGGVYDPSDSPAGGRDTYWVLFAEAGGTPSAPPPVPSGREEPRPNETCPTWVHDQYTTTGPDGRIYPTWHQLIDPVYWCYHRHEHGSDPAHFGEDHTVAFGYVAAAHGMDEPHAGFKNLTFESGGTRWWIAMHFGTAGLARACNRFHTFEVAARDAATGELLADLRLMADYGRSVVNAGDAWLTPPTCPDQAAQAVAAGSTGIRKLPSQETRGIGYEPWRPDFRLAVLGLSGSLVINTFDPMVICNTAQCDRPVVTGKSGSGRFLDANGFTITAGARNSGVFYTDVTGRTFVGPNDHGAIRQFIKPGLTLTLNHGDKCRDVAAWGRPFVCNGPTAAEPTDREKAIEAPN